MRPLIIQVPKGNGNKVVEIAKKYEGKNISQMSGRGTEQEQDIVFSYISNRRVEKYIEELSEIPEIQLTLFPQGVMALYPPQNQAPDQVTDIEARSPIEIFLAGLQSKGSWNGFLGYAAIASVIVWIGLYTNTTYLLVAAMLIAPFAGPAMNTAIATARGDWALMKRGLLRYFASISITILATFLLSLMWGQGKETTLMVDISQISSVASVLALSAGIAGALNLVQSERSSLVSAAATGMLVAASLAPPAGLVGMALALGRYDMAKSGLYLIILQLFGINFSGSIIFKLFGLNYKGARYNRGKRHIFWVSIIITVLALGAIIFFQLRTNPFLQRSSISKRISAEVGNIINEYPSAKLIETNVRFTRADIEGQNSLLSVVYVQRSSDSNLSSEVIKKQLTTSIQHGITQSFENITPLVEVIVLEPTK